MGKLIDTARLVGPATAEGAVAALESVTLRAVDAAKRAQAAAAAARAAADQANLAMNELAAMHAKVQRAEGAPLPVPARTDEVRGGPAGAAPRLLTVRAMPPPALPVELGDADAPLPQHLAAPDHAGLAEPGDHRRLAAAPPPLHRAVLLAPLTVGTLRLEEGDPDALAAGPSSLLAVPVPELRQMLVGLPVVTLSLARGEPFLGRQAYAQADAVTLPGAAALVLLAGAHHHHAAFGHLVAAAPPTTHATLATALAGRQYFTERGLFAAVAALAASHLPDAHGDRAAPPDPTATQTAIALAAAAIGGRSLGEGHDALVPLVAPLVAAVAAVGHIGPAARPRASARLGFVAGSYVRGAMAVDAARRGRAQNRGGWVRLAAATACAAISGPFVLKVMLPTLTAWTRPLAQQPAAAPAVAGLATALSDTAARAGTTPDSPLDLPAYLAQFQALLPPVPA